MMISTFLAPDTSIIDDKSILAAKYLSLCPLNSKKLNKNRPQKMLVSMLASSVAISTILSPFEVFQEAKSC